MSRAWKKQTSQNLVTLDHLWWRIRDHLDSYLEVADSEIRQVQKSFVALSNYENCQADFEGLLQSYASSTSKMKKGHQKLKTTWREAGTQKQRIALSMFGYVIWKYLELTSKAEESLVSYLKPQANMTCRRYKEEGSENHNFSSLF